jgi:hypothetical protein
LQFVFKKKTDWNIDQTARRATEGEQNDQDAEIEENALPH